MKYLYQFKTNTEYNEQEPNLPYINVSYVERGDTVHYNDYHDQIEQTPFTITIKSIDNYDPNNTYYLHCDPASDDSFSFWKYSLDGVTWQDFENQWYLTDVHANDQIQIIGDAYRGTAHIYLSNNEGACNGSLKLSGNYFSTVNGYDYANNPHFIDTGEEPLNSFCYDLPVHNITDTSELWLPKRGLIDNSYCNLFKELPNLTNANLDLRSDVVPYHAFNCTYYNCPNLTGEAIIGSYNLHDYGYVDTFSHSGISKITITHLNKNITECNISNYCPNLTEIVNYTNHHVNIADPNDAEQWSETPGTLYYVDYGAEMAYDPASMVPSSWSLVQIDPNE